jgi:DNA-binding response OmpR family regulator
LNESELQPPSARPAPDLPASGPRARPIVLVCEDEPALRELVRVSLGSAYAFLEAEDGEEAVDLLRSYRPDVLILDLMLPRRSGLEVLSQLRTDPSLGTVATIVLTAQPDYEHRARELGAARVVAKPFLPEELAATVRAVLEERR